MQTLADLKRALTLGTAVTLIKAPFEHRNLLTQRYVVKVQGNGIELSPDKDAKKGSFMDFPKAALLSFEDSSFTIHAPAQRELTAQEKKIMDNQPSNRPENKAQVEIDIMTDGSNMFHADRRYFKDQDAEYLEGFNTVRGKRYGFNTKQITDEAIIGEPLFTYHLS